MLKKILESPVVHVDETKINIQGVSQYVWVITDGLHVIFRQTETREPTLIHELFDGYLGVLCSDFYGGYDSIDCLQQKCWAHLIRDLNDDLRKTPFDTELESFVSEVRDLIVPIFDTVEKYGLKKMHLTWRGIIDDDLPLSDIDLQSTVKTILISCKTKKLNLSFRVSSISY